MLDNVIFVLMFLAALGSSLIGGVFFAFSTSVMKALGRLPSDQGMAAMQLINIVIVNPSFLGVFLGTGVVCAVLTVISLLRWDRPALFVIAGAALYLLGSLLVTLVLNVPLNNALAATTDDDPNRAGLWANYLSDWTFWNHVRTAASIGAAALLTIALLKIAG